jgi:hypothetical protein
LYTKFNKNFFTQRKFHFVFLRQETSLAHSVRSLLAQSANFVLTFFYCLLLLVHVCLWDATFTWSQLRTASPKIIDSSLMSVVWFFFSCSSSSHASFVHQSRSTQYLFFILWPTKPDNISQTVYFYFKYYNFVFSKMSHEYNINIKNKSEMIILNECLIWER